MSLDKIEIDELIKKLRDKYKEYAKQHSPKWFSLEAFDERLSVAIKKGMNLEAFILAEISNFEKLKERYDTKKKSKITFGNEVDRIIDENISRIKKYPSILFHAKGDLEIIHFYGALNRLLFEYLPGFRVFLTDSKLKNREFLLDERLIYLAGRRGEEHSKRIIDHILIINRKGVRDIEIERDSSEYLKEGAFCLHDLVDFCDEILDTKNDEWNYPLTFEKLFIEEARKKIVIDNFNGLTGYGAVLKIREFTNNIIQDFRLVAFKRAT